MKSTNEAKDNTGSVTNHKEVEEALRESEQKYKRIFESFIDLYYQTDAEGIITILSPSVYQLSGWQPEELIGRPVLDIYVDPQEREKLLNEIQGKGFVTGYKVTLRKKDGTPTPTMLSARIVYDASGKAVGIEGSLRDISEWVNAEKQLRDSESRYRSLYKMMRLLCDNVPDLIWAKDLDMRYLFTNRAICEKLLKAIDPDEPTGKTDIDFADRERAAQPNNPDWHTFSEICRASDDIVARTGKAERFEEFGYVRGKPLCLDVYKAPFVDEDGKMIGTVGCGRDVTYEKELEVEQRKIEQALRESEALFRTLVRQLRDGVLILDAKGNCLFGNLAAAKMVGLDPPAEGLGMNITKFLEPSSVPQALAHMKTIISEGNHPPITEYPFRDAAGRLKWIEAVGGQIEFRGQKADLVTIRDITERKRVEEALRQSEENYRSIFENAPLGIFHSTVDGQFISANPALASMLGYKSPEEMIHEVNQKNIGEVLYDHPDARNALLKKASLLEQWHTIENRFRRKDGKIATAKVIFRPFRRKKSKLVEIEGFVEDITERKRMEEEQAKLEEQFRQAQKMESIGRLAGGIAHDFNNLLLPIMGYTEMILADLHPSDRRHKQASNIYMAAERARDLVRHLLAFSRKQVLNLKLEDLKSIIIGFEKMLHRTIRKNITIRISMPDTPLMIRADIGQIEQVLMNLAVNAQDAMPQGGDFMISLGEAAVDHAYASGHPGMIPGDYISMTVSDTGSGMDQETLEQLFEPFFTTKEPEHGTGLGLSTVYGIVKQHDGYIEVESQPGSGSRFKIYLPNRKKEEKPAPVSAPQKTVEVLGGGETVLVAEDDDMVRQLTCQMLEFQGYRVVAAATAEQCLGFIEEGKTPIDLLLTDVIMPSMNGKELYRMLSARQKGLKVLYMSGHPSNVIVHQGVLEKGVHFIQKPFSMAVLAQKIREALAS